MKFYFFDRFRNRVSKKEVMAQMGPNWKPLKEIVRVVVEAKGGSPLFVANAYRALRGLAEDGKVERRKEPSGVSEYRLVSASDKKKGKQGALPQTEGLMKRPSES